MGDPVRPNPPLPSYREAIQARRWVGVDLEGDRETADQLIGSDTWVSTEPDGGLYLTTIYLEECLRRLQGIEVMVDTLTTLGRPPTQLEADILSMIRRGAWAPPVA